MFIQPKETTNYLTCSMNSFSSSDKEVKMETQKVFTNEIWEKISDTSKKSLQQNNYVFPNDIEGNYSYYCWGYDKFIIDKTTKLAKNIATYESIHLGQNLNTNEFLEFKSLHCEDKHDIESMQEVVSHRKLNRLRAAIYDPQNNKVLLASKLVEGVSLDDYRWSIHCKDFAESIKLAISYLDELEFIEKSDVILSYHPKRRVLVDLKIKKIFVDDFARNPWVYGSSERIFKAMDHQPYINEADISVIKHLLPNKGSLSGKETWYEKFVNLQREIENIRNHPNNFDAQWYWTTICEMRQQLQQVIDSMKE